MRQVDELFAKWNTSGSPGCAVGISRNGTAVYEHGYGIANLDLGVAITPAAVFDRHLLTHTSGLRDGFLLQGLAPGQAEGINQQIVGILSRARGFNFVPGTEFEYNNSAYTLLAGIVERVSGEPFPAFAESHIFKPLGMTQTHFHDDAGRIVPNRATGYSRAPNGFRLAVRTYTDIVVGNAGLLTTVGDLLRWEQNLADVRVGDAALIAEMQRPAIRTSWSEASGYGFGVEIASHRGLRTIGHGGGDEGRRTYVVRYPDQGLAIAVLCNLDDIDPAALSRSIADVFLGNAFPEAASPRTTGAPSTPAPVSLPLEALRSKAGLYRSVSDDSVGRIFLRDGKLMASETASDAGGYELTPIGENRFAIPGTPIVAEFVPGAAGRPQELHVRGAGPKPMVAQLITTPFAPSSAQLRAFEGTYTSDEVHGTYTVVTHDSGLTIQIPGRSDIPLQPLFADAFGGKMRHAIRPRTIDCMLNRGRSIARSDPHGLMHQEESCVNDGFFACASSSTLRWVCGRSTRNRLPPHTWARGRAPGKCLAWGRGASS